MPTKQIIKPAKSAPAVGPYNHAVRIGDLLFCAGQIPLDPATGDLVKGDIKAQTERVLENVKAILDDQKLSFNNVVKSTVFLTNLADFAGMNEVYAKYFTGDFPARSTIQVAALPKGANVEIEVIAHFWCVDPGPTQAAQVTSLLNRCGLMSPTPLEAGRTDHYEWGF